jgi:secreted trypsin-like serine protease
MLALAAWLALLAPVVGGSPVSANQFPDVVLVAGWSGVCSGVLVAPDVVLTAGHCSEIDAQAVLVGSVDYAVPTGRLIAIAKVIAYPDWQHAFDVAVVVLAEPVVDVTPRAIADDCTPANAGELRVVGFGLDDPGGSGASTALESALVTIDDATCTTDPACRSAIAPDAELVAGGNGATACFGDSGGPLLAPAAASGAPAVLVGVVSRSTGEAATPCESPSVYVRADVVAPWIEATTDRTLARAPCAPDGATALDAATPADGCAATRGGSPLAAGWLALAFGLSVTRRRRSAGRRA